MFIKTMATDKILKLSKRLRCVAGGTGASKTISILLWLIDKAQTNDNLLISVVSESFPHLKRGVIRDFLNILKTHKYFRDALWNKTDFIYIFETGSKIEFFSADQPGKVRGPRRDILFINEANNISYETYTQLEIRTKEIIWLDWNPVSEFWFYTEILGKVDCDFITLTYRDNEALDKQIVSAIESRRGNRNWWLVYGEGQLGEAEGKIYKDWLTIDEIPHEARLERYGMDFGYSCLDGNTKIKTIDGNRSIKNIKVGDFVLTRNGYQRVSWSGSKGVKTVYRVDFGYGKRVIITGDHLIYTKSGWKRIDQLKDKETICVECHVLKNVQVYLQQLKEKREVFDLTVDNDHEFFANGVLVHNCDPTAIVAIYKYNNGYILDQITYQKGLSNKQIADILINQSAALVVADSAEPKSIDEIRSYGISIVGSQKGQGSVLQGIQYVQQQRISVTKRSLDILKEYRNFLWQTDKEGKIINEPEVAFKHAMDAISYGMNSLKPYEEDIIIPDDTVMFKEGFF